MNAAERGLAERDDRSSPAGRGPSARHAMSLILVNVGYDNFAVADRIIAIVGCTSAPVRRLIQECRQNGRLLDATQGRRMRSVVLMDTGHILMSALTPETLARRAAASRPLDGEGEEPADE